MLIELSDEEAGLLIEALNSHVYWQLSEQGQRNSGDVIVEPGDENAREIAEAQELSERLEVTLQENAKREQAAQAMGTLADEDGADCPDTEVIP